jgi:hypothetical protein
MPLRCRGLPLRHRHELETWTTETWIATAPAEVVAVMVEPDAIARWSSVPHELLELYGDPLESGSRARVRGSLRGLGRITDGTLAAGALRASVARLGREAQTRAHR